MRYWIITILQCALIALAGFEIGPNILWESFILSLFPMLITFVILTACYDAGYTTYRREKSNHYGDSNLNWLQIEAKKGSAYAQYILGIIYYEGEVVAQNYNLALEWLQKAAKQNNIRAQCKIGSMYIEGKGVAQNFKLAEQWFRKANGKYTDAEACHYLGLIYESGLGVDKDHEIACSWYKKSSEEGMYKLRNRDSAWTALRFNSESTVYKKQVSRTVLNVAFFFSFFGLVATTSEHIGSGRLSALVAISIAFIFFSYLLFRKGYRAA